MHRIEALVLAFVMVFGGGMVSAPSAAGPTKYEIQAGYVYKLLFFCDWPNKVVEDDNDLIVGIIGEDPFRELFQKVDGTEVKGKTLRLKYFSKSASVESLGKCHILYFGTDFTGAELRATLQALRHSQVLTIGEYKTFNTNGGMLRFWILGNKVFFDINKTQSDAVDIHFRSQLLRIAKSVT
jgi:hypothetical protein